MIQCPECGKLLAPGSIHTCSPQVVEDFPDARLPDVAAPSGWLTMTEDEFSAMSRRFATAVADAIAEMHAQRRAKDEVKKALQQERVRCEELRDATTAECAQLMGRAAALRQLAEEMADAIDVWCTHPGCEFTSPPRCKIAKRFLARLAEIGGGE